MARLVVSLDSLHVLASKGTYIKSLVTIHRKLMARICWSSQGRVLILQCCKAQSVVCKDT